MNPQYIIEPLDNKKHISKDFNCGVSELNRYLQERASQEVKKNISAVYIVRASDSFATLGYFTLSSSSITLSNLPKELAKKLPTYKTLPVILLGRLAVAKTMQGKHVGTYLLMEAITRSYALSKQIGSFAVVVDAKNKSKSILRKVWFYSICGHTIKIISSHEDYPTISTILKR